MVVSEIATLVIYAVSMAFLPEYFGECLRTIPLTSTMLMVV